MSLLRYVACQARGWQVGEFQIIPEMAGRQPIEGGKRVRESQVLDEHKVQIKHKHFLDDTFALKPSWLVGYDQNMHVNLLQKACPGQ